MREFYLFLRSNFYLFAFLCFLSIFSYVYYRFSFYLDTQGLYDVLRKVVKAVSFSIFLNIFLVHICWLFVKEKARVFIIILCIIAAISTLVDVFLLNTYTVIFNPMMFDAVLGTNFRESVEFLQAHIRAEQIILVLTYLFITILLFALALKKKQAGKEVSKKALSIFYSIYIIIGIITISSFAVNFIKKSEPAYKALSRFSDSSLSRIAFVAYSHFSANEDSDKIIENYNNIKMGDNQASNNIQNIALIIGESAQRKYHSIYGFALQTSPKLEALVKNGNLLIFDDVVTAWGNTPASVTTMLTFGDEFRAGGSWSNYPTLEMLFRSAKYKSNFLTNQDMLYSVNSKAVGIVYKMSDYKASGVPFVNDHWQINSGTFYDSNLLPLLEPIKAEQNPQFSMIQLSGSHFFYKKRYPSDFAKYSAKDIDELFIKQNDPRAKLDEERKQRIAEYINSIFYTDFILDEIFKVFKDKDSIVIYTSDHGENIYEYKNSMGHGAGSRFGAEIPFVVFVSDEFKAKHKELYERLKKAQNTAFITSQMPHLLCDIAGIEHELCDKSKSFINENFKPLKRIINGSINYDETLKNQQISVN